MTKSELMILKLIEECAEVQQRAAKMMQFGPDESQSTAPRNLGGENPPAGTNRERLQAELLDLCAVAELLGFRYPTAGEVSAKFAKIERYCPLSKKTKRGLISLTPLGNRMLTKVNQLNLQQRRKSKLSKKALIGRER